MRHSVCSVLAALIIFMVIFPVLPIGGAPAPGGPPPGSGRAEGDPPAEGNKWDIVRDYTITGSTRTFAGDITVFSGVNLYIRNMGRLVVPQKASGHWTMFVKAGGNVEVVDNSELLVDHYIAESGTGLTVLNNSVITANGVFNATSSVTFTDSTLTVTAPDGKDPSQPGEAAKLHLDSGTGGNIQRATLAVTGGDGQDGVQFDGTEGGAGGSVSVVVTSKDFSAMRLVAQSGGGGKGGTTGGSTLDGGKGGRGGNLDLKVVGSSFMNSTITAASGKGGKGLDGFSPANADAGSGGEGGEGGAVNFTWTGKGISVSQGSNITVLSGQGGEGGKGGLAQSSLKAGGNGGRGGNGGSITATVASNGTFDMTDSVISFRAGYGPAGGVFGRATGGGKDGSAGDGGDGGQCALQVMLNDAYTASNASLEAEAGDGGSGGLGSTGGKGGSGGTGLLNMTLTTLLSENTVSVRNGALASHGGDGGPGGKGLSSGVSKGQPGDGGKGGGARLFIDADKSVELTGSRLLCDEGLAGPADPPAKQGNPGVGELYIYTSKVNMRNTVYSQTMGWVDGNDLWRLESSPLVRTHPPTKPPHFLPPVESGVAEELWMLNVLVRDILGNPITDGTVTVEVHFGERLAASKKANAFGLASFQMAGSRYSTDAANDYFGRVYSVKAVKDSGEFAYPVSAQMVEDKNITLTIITKPFAPYCNITYPLEKETPVMDASQYLRPEGRIETVLIQGTAQDHPLNAMPVISAVQVRIGEDGPWTNANFEMFTQNFYKWNLTWDIYNWSLSKLAQYPSGIIPAPIYARSFNDMSWSDDVAFGGNRTLANITVRLLKIPPPLPKIEITKPVTSPTSGGPGSVNLSFEKIIFFDGKVINASGTRIIRWEWYFDAASGKPDFSSPVSPATNVSYPIYKNDEYLDVWLKVFDNESARRVELYRAGIAYDEFGYEFDTTDGSTYVKLRVYIKPVKVVQEDQVMVFLKRYWSVLTLGIVSLVMMVGAVQTFRVRQRTIAERKAKLDRESLRIDVSEMKCARCNEPIADPAAGCLLCKAQDALGQTQQRLLDMKGAGINVTDAESLLEVGVDAFDAKSYTEAYEKAQAAKAKAGELEEKYTKTAKVINGWETRIAAMKVDRPEADVSDAETRVYHSRLALGRGDHDEAIRNLDGLEGVLAKADKVGVKKAAVELLESTKRMLANIQKRGVIADPRITAAISEAEGAIEKGSYDLVTSRCREAETLVKETNKSFMRASESLRQSEARVLNAKGMGQGVGGTEDWLAQAKTAMAGGNYGSVIDLTGRVLGFFGVAAKPFGTEKKVDWKREVAVLEGVEGKAAAPKPVAAAPPKPAPVLEVEVSPELKDAAERLIKEAHDAVARAREAAADVTDGEGLLEKARDAYKARRYDEAQDLAKSAKFLLAELAAAAPKAKPGAPPAPLPRPVAPAVPARPAAVSGAAAELKAFIDKADDLLVELAAAGGDISGPESKLKRAKAARDGGSPAVAMQYAKEAIDETEGLMKEYLEAKNAMETVQKDLAAAKARGLDVADAEFQLKQARAAMSGGAFTRAADTAKMVDQMLKELEPAGAPPKIAPAPVAPAATGEAAPKGPVKCPSCGRDAKPHWKTCPFCGASITAEKPVAAAPRPAAAAAPAVQEAPKAPAVSPAPAAPKAPAITPAPEAPKPAAPMAEPGPKAASCPKCGAALKPHWKVCPACGADVSAQAPAAAPAAPKVLKCPACGSKIEPAWTSCPICLTALVPEKGYAPEAPKKVIKVVKKAVAPDEKEPEAPGKADEKAPVLKVEKKPVIVARDEDKK